MALIHCHFFSEVLELTTAMDVILPQPLLAQSDQLAVEAKRKYPTLYLLHGLSDDQTIWQRRTSIERYVRYTDLAVVMPAVQRSFYTDMAYGYRYWTFISEELPALARAFFPLSEAREDNFVAGLSMGGYGAFKLALTYPNRYAAAASLSGALDIVSVAQTEGETWQAEMRVIFGELDRLAGSSNDLFYLAQQLATTEVRPKLYQCCGTEDFLYEGNLRFKEWAASLGLDLIYEDGPGEHEWGYWDRQIQRVLAWLPLPPSARHPVPPPRSPVRRHEDNPKLI
jgi:S-formylglutathione hydrolase FrmB